MPYTIITDRCEDFADCVDACLAAGILNSQLLFLKFLMLKAEYLGTGAYEVDKFKHLDDNQLIVTAFPYRTRQNVLNELVANAVVGGGFPYSCREIEAALKQVLNELPDNYNTFTEKNSRFCIKISW